MAHSIGVIDVVAKNDGFIHRVGTFQVIGNSLRHQHGALINHQRAVKIFQVVDTVFNLFAVFIELAFDGAPALDIYINVNAHDFVRGEETVFNTLFQRIGVNRLTEVVDIRNVFRFFWRCRQTDLSGAAEILQNLSPG